MRELSDTTEVCNVIYFALLGAVLLHVCDIGVGDGPLALTTRLQTQLSRLLEEHQSLLKSVNQPEATTI